MAARDILNLDNPLASRLIRCLYVVALVLITVMVLVGVIRGVRMMSRLATPPTAMMDNAAPGVATPAPPPPGMMQRFDDRRMMGRRGDFGGRRRMGPFGIGRNPMLAGLFVIFGALLRGAIGLMVVRILAELALAILAMPRRTETP